MFASADPVVVGSNITYTIQINNNGRSPFTGVTNIVQFPSNAPIISVSATAGNISTNAGRVVLNIGNMTNNASITETIVLGTTSPGNMTSTATVSSIETPTLEPNTDNNVSTVISTIQGIADVRVSTASGAPNPVIVGSNLTYTITVANKGPWPATSVVLTDALPASLTFVSAITNGLSSYSYDANNGVISFNFATQTNGGSATVTINAIAMTSGVVTNIATVSAFELDLSTNNNTGTVVTTINALTDVAIGQTGPATGLAGSNVIYTLRVTNNGPSAASSTIVTDPVPAGASFVSATTSRGTFSQTNRVVTWMLGNIVSNGTATLTLTVQPTADGVLTNVATVTNSAGTDLVAANNSASWTTTIGPAADLAIGLTGPMTGLAGSNVTYTLRVTNNGPSAAASTAVTDPLPAGASFVSATTSRGTFSQTNRVVTWMLGNIVSNGTATLTLTVQPTADGVLTNLAAVTNSAGTDLVAANNSASWTTTIGPAADLAIGLTGPMTGLAGSNVTYTLRVTNNGPSAAASTAVTDPLPAGASFVSATTSRGTFSQTNRVVTW